MDLPSLQLPDFLNYIGLFLTLECNLRCSYCINDPLQQGRRGTLFPVQGNRVRRTLTPDEWARALNRIPFREDLPITFQGGEPMLYWGGKGLGMIFSAIPHHCDLLTNFVLKPEIFAGSLSGQHHKLQRDAPYPSIRVSYHTDEMNRTWPGRGFVELVGRCEALRDQGFRVSPDKAKSDVGIYMVDHPENHITLEMQAAYHGKVPFETKEFLGVFEGRLFGRYLYPFSTDLTLRGFFQRPLSCECRTTELLLDPLGFVWGCHLFLYESWKGDGLLKEFDALEAQDFRYAQNADKIFAGRNMTPVGHLLDPEFQMRHLAVYRPCQHYGRCIGCDTKIKNDRFQSYYDHAVPHTSVDIRSIKMPIHLYDKIENLAQVQKFLSPENSNK